MKVFIAFATLCFGATVFAAERPKAPAGFRWKEFKEAYCAIQVPDGWFEARRTAGITQTILLSPEKIHDGRGIDIGFTMNAVKCRSQQEWQNAMELAGKMMSEARKATERPVESRVEETDDVVFMVVEGERFIADSPHPEKKYHVRMIVRAFPKFATVYLYSFGAPIDEWKEAWKQGGTMLGPVWFTLRR